MPIQPFDDDTHCGAKPRRCGVEGMECKHTDGDHRCRAAKGWGTDHVGVGACKHHGGTTRNHERSAGRQIAQAFLTSMGHPIEKDPQTALLELVWEAAGNVAFLRAQVQSLGPDLVLRVSEVAARPSDVTVEDPDGDEIASAHSRMISVKEAARAIVELYGQWSDRLAKYSKAAIDAGIAERQVQLAEAQGYAIRDLIEAVLDGLNIDDEQRKVGREIAGTRLRLLAGAA